MAPGPATRSDDRDDRSTPGSSSRVWNSSGAPCSTVIRSAAISVAIWCTSKTGTGSTAAPYSTLVSTTALRPKQWKNGGKPSMRSPWRSPRDRPYSV